jgi:hypothetical protein
MTISYKRLGIKEKIKWTSAKLLELISESDKEKQKDLEVVYSYT